MYNLVRAAVRPLASIKVHCLDLEYFPEVSSTPQSFAEVSGGLGSKGLERVIHTVRESCFLLEEPKEFDQREKMP